MGLVGCKIEDMRILGIICIAIVLFGCKKLTLDGLAFPAEKTDQYLLEQFEGSTEIDVPAQYDLTAADRTLVTFTSTDQETGDEYTLYGVYIGDMANIATDTVILYLHGQSKHIDYYWSRTALLAHAGGQLNYCLLYTSPSPRDA